MDVPTVIAQDKAAALSRLMTLTKMSDSLRKELWHMIDEYVEAKIAEAEYYE
jgi:hypothetical protein